MKRTLLEKQAQRVAGALATRANSEWGHRKEFQDFHRHFEWERAETEAGVISGNGRGPLLPLDTGSRPAHPRRIRHPKGGTAHFRDNVPHQLSSALRKHSELQADLLDQDGTSLLNQYQAPKIQDEGLLRVGKGLVMENKIGWRIK